MDEENLKDVPNTGNVGNENPIPEKSANTGNGNPIPENPANNGEKPPKKKKGKAGKVILIIFILLLIAAIVIGILIFTGVIDINLDKKSKMEAGVEQLIESYTEPVKTLSATAKDNNTGIKVLENVSLDSPVEVSTEFSGNVNIDDIAGMTTSEKKQLQQVTDLIGKSSLALDFKYDGNKQVYANLSGNLDDVELSGEALYDGTQAGIRSKELNEKWLIASNDDLSMSLANQNVDLDELKEYAEKATTELSSVMKNLAIDTNTQTEIQERYENVLKEFIKEKSKDIESKDAKVEVDGKTKKCSKLSLELDDSDIKELIIDYIDEFGKDTQLQDILKNYLKEMDEIAKSSNSYYSSNYEKSFETMLKNLDSVKDEIEDEFELDSTITLDVYGTSSETYRTDIIIENSGEELVLETTFNKNETVTVVKFEEQEMATITVSYDTNFIEYKVKVTYQNVKAEVGLRYEVNGDDTLVKLSYSQGDLGNVEYTLKNSIDTNTDKEYDGTITVGVKADVKDGINMNAEFNAKTKISLDDVDIPTISETEKVDASNAEALQEYQTEAQTKLEEIMKKVQEIEAIAPLIEELIDG